MGIEIISQDDIRRLPSRRYHHDLENCRESLEKYIPWIKEQISKSKEGSIRIRRYDLGKAVKKELKIIMGDTYREKSFNTIYFMIIAVLYNEGIFAEFGCYNREKLFIMRNKTTEDHLTVNLRKFEKCSEEEDI